MSNDPKLTSSLYEVQYMYWELWGQRKTVDVAYFQIKSSEDPASASLVKLLGNLGYRVGFKNSARRGIKLLGMPRRVNKIPRLEP